MGYQRSEPRKLEKYSTDCYEVRISFILIAIFLYHSLYSSLSREPWEAGKKIMEFPNTCRQGK